MPEKKELPVPFPPPGPISVGGIGGGLKETMGQLETNFDLTRLKKAGVENLLSQTNFPIWPEGVDDIPAGWTAEGTASYSRDTHPGGGDGGYSIKITAGAGNSGIKQVIPCKELTYYTLSFLVKVTSGDMARVTISDGTNTITRNFTNTDWLRCPSALLKKIVFKTVAGATELTIMFLAAHNTDIVWFAQVNVRQGQIDGRDNNTIPVTKDEKLYVDEVNIKITADPNEVQYTSIGEAEMVDIAAAVAASHIQASGNDADKGTAVVNKLYFALDTGTIYIGTA